MNPYILAAKVAIPCAMALGAYFWHQSMLHHYRDEIIASINAKNQAIIAEQEKKAADALEVLYQNQLDAKEERLQNEKVINSLHGKLSGRLRCTTGSSSVQVSGASTDKTPTGETGRILPEWSDRDVSDKVIDLLKEAEEQNAAIIEFNKTYAKP